MTGAALRSTLATMLASQLGTYTLRDATTTTPAITVGEPPDGATCTGLEVLVNDVPEFTPVAAYQTSAVQEAHRVRLVSHNADRGDVTTAIRKILSRWSTASIAEVPGNDRLGIPYQAVITIPA